MVTKIAKNHQQPAFGIKIETETVDFLLHWNQKLLHFQNVPSFVCTAHLTKGESYCSKPHRATGRKGSSYYGNNGSQYSSSSLFVLDCPTGDSIGMQGTESILKDTCISL